MKITQADAPTIWMDCHLIQTKWYPTSTIPTIFFYARCPFWHNPPNLSWLGTGTVRQQICWLAYPVAWLKLWLYAVCITRF